MNEFEPMFSHEDIKVLLEDIDRLMNAIDNLLKELDEEQ